MIETSTIIENKITNNPCEEWKTPSEEERELYSSDDLLNAYLKGQKNIIQKLGGKAANEFMNYLNDAKRISEGLFKILLSHGIECKCMFLKINGANDFESLYIAPCNDYISPQFREIYKLFLLEEEKVNKDSFHYSFSIMPDSDHINRNALSSDGYILRYE